MAGSDRLGEFFEAVLRAIDSGAPIIPEQARRDSFDAAADHVATLLADAVGAWDRGSHGTAVFLAITAIEETAKAEILIFRKTDRRPPGGGGRRDPLYDHKTKHRIAIRPTTFMGRLPKLLGEEACQRLAAMAANGDFGRLRERALYATFDGGKLETPAVAITRESAREILLLALEIADDILVGYTDHSYELGRRFETWIGELAPVN